MDLYKQFPDSSLNFDSEYEELLEKFNKYEVTIFDLLSTSPLEISNKIGVPVHVINKFISILKTSTSQKSKIIKGDEILIEKFTTGDAKFDKLLNGGIRIGEITEIFGESSTAKSQFCMQLTKTIQLNPEEGGLLGNAIYISTEGSLETKRLIEINDQIDNVYYINCTDLETQEHILNVQLPIILKDSSKNIKLVIIDSISHHLRVELLSTNYEIFLQNQKYISNLSLYLNKLCVEMGISIVVTNQISDKPKNQILNTDFKKITYDYQIGWLSGWNEQIIKSRQDNDEGNNNNEGKTKIATLGNNWSNSIGVRLLLKKTYKPKYNYNHKSVDTYNNNSDVVVETGYNEELNDDNNWIMKRTMSLIFSNNSIKNGINDCVNNDNENVYDNENVDEIEFKIHKEGLKSI